MRELRQVFADAGCEGTLFAMRLGGAETVELEADRVVALASVFKIAVALAFERAAAAGELDPAERALLAAADRTPGPTGLSVCLDDAALSYRDLAYLMMSVSDNAATDAVIGRVGLDRINAMLRELGLRQTEVPGAMRDELDGVAADLGFASWRQVQDAQAGRMGEEARVRSTDLSRIAASRVLDPARGWRGTAREVAGLVAAIWEDRAGPEPACARVRWLMGHQGRSRIAASLPDGVRPFVKSGSLFGVARNEAGVLEYPDGQRYVVAVFTRAHRPFAGTRAIEAAIGAACRVAVDHLRER